MDLETKAKQDNGLRTRIEAASSKIERFKSQIVLKKVDFDVFSAQKEIELIKSQLN